MSKTSLLLASLVGAIPGWILSVLMAMAFLQRADLMTTMMKVLAGLTLILSATVALTPVGIMLFTPKIIGQPVPVRQGAGGPAPGGDSEAGGETGESSESAADASDDLGGEEVDQTDVDISDGDLDFDEDAGEFESGEEVEADEETGDDLFAEDDGALSDFDLDFDEDEK